MNESELYKNAWSPDKGKRKMEREYSVHPNQMNRIQNPDGARSDFERAPSFSISIVPSSQDADNYLMVR